MKRALALFLVVLICIESFAAVVSDNDGSAFITKAEFDSLKNNFQAQIDQYNTSIDSKIDGAIASYLAGIQVAKTEEVKTICSPSDGVTSIESSSFPWTEGKMDVKLYGTLLRYSRSDRQGVFNFVASSNGGGTPFYETLVYDINNSGYARFGGYNKTKQYSVLNGQSFGPYNFQQMEYTTITTIYAGVYPVSNIILTNDDTDQLLMVGFYGDVQVDDLWGWNQLRYYGNQCSFRREIQNTDANTFNGGVILNSASLTHKFNNNDDITDWCNDTTTDGHSYFSRWNQQNWTGTGTSYHILDNANTTITDVTLDNTTSYTTDSRSEEGTLQRPYFGFANQVGNWNKIYDPNLDLNYDEVLLDSDGNKSKNTIVNKGSNHVKLGAGLPIVEVKQGDKVTYEFDFKNKTADYAVWVKIGSFDSTKNLADDKTDVITSFTTYGSTTYVSGWKGLKIVNGTGKCTFKAEKDGIVFMKWSWASATSTDGGGVLSPAKSVVIEHES